MGGSSGSRADASSPQAVSTKGFDPGRKWTPGPWAARPILHEETTQFVKKGQPNGEWEVIFEDNQKTASEDPWFVAVICDGCPGSTEANAHLIAAAPELYKYLALAVGVINGAGIVWGGNEAASSALRKARGEHD
jgi:hypothetical protein